jgi:uracil-DNA glycosylase
MLWLVWELCSIRLFKNSMDKAQKLAEIASEIEKCKLCKIGKIGKAVPGEGNPDADVVFIGEAPGKNEAQTGRPFIGRSGKYLRSLINEIGLSEDDVFITSPVKYLPKRGTPTRQDIEHGKIHFDKQLEVIDPKIIVLLGSVAVQGVLNEKIPTLKNHGRVIEKEGRKFFLTIHPAAGIRFPPLKKLIEQDFKKLQTLIS